MTYYDTNHTHPFRVGDTDTGDSPELDISPASSPGAVTPPGGAPSPSSSTFLSSSVSSLWGGLKRRFSSEPSPATATPPPPAGLPHARTFQPDGLKGSGLLDGGGVCTPPHLLHPHRTMSPMRPPPLEPLQLEGFAAETSPEARLLTAPVAEEIRIMVPARLGIVDEWRLVYSLEQDGASLATLYEKCAAFQGRRVGFVLVVKDCEGGVRFSHPTPCHPSSLPKHTITNHPFVSLQLFGAYLSDHPHPAPKYFGTGECFLWRASLLPALPPPPPSTSTSNPPTPSISRTPTPSSQRSTQSIRFKAFPYSGINEYYLLCETHFLSLGAGDDGKFGLWLDDSLERGVSATSLTYGNEPLSEEGEKFGVLGVEVWVVGA